MNFRRCVLWLVCALPLLASSRVQGAFSAVLQGRHAGSSSWTTSSLRNWRELDLVPVRVYMTGGPASNRTFRIEFDHLKSGTPAIENLSMFTFSPNVVVTSGPTADTPAGSATWAYSITFSLTNSSPGYIEFRARLASGARLTSGASFRLVGAPVSCLLKFYKISAACDTDLILKKTGPATARPGEVITYTLSYSNKATAAGPAGNVELTDVLPTGVAYVSNSASLAPTVAGNTLTWRLGILDRRSNGVITFRALIATTVTNQQTVENVSGITTEQRDVCPADNTSRWRTKITGNTAPRAQDDHHTVRENDTLTVSAPGVLANDTDADNHALTAILVSPPQHGQLSFLSNGSFIYTPNAGFSGSDSFTYKASDGLTNSNPARVSITVEPVNDAPMARPDAYELLEDAVLTIAAPGVLGNDTDSDSTVLRALVVSNPAHGTLTLNANGGFTYRPAKDFFGTDAFTYRASDEMANSAPVTVALTVKPVNDAPGFIKGPNQLVANNNGAKTVPGWATAITPGPANETHQTVQFLVNNDRNDLFAVQPAIAANGTLTYTPAANTYGLATLTVVLKDDGGTANGGVDTSAPETFTIRLNAPPTATLIIPTNGTIFLAPANVPIVATAEDSDGTVQKVEILESVTNVLREFAQMPYSLIWSNVPAGTYHLLARATDDLGAVGTSATSTIMVLDGPPVATGSMRFNPQTGLFEQPVRVSNPSSFDFGAVCVFVSNLPPRYRVWNASGTSNGLPFVQFNRTVAAGGHADLIIEYYDPQRIAPTPHLSARAVSLMEPINPAGTELRVYRQRWLNDGTFLLEFNSALHRTYYVQYCDDMVTWKTAVPAIRGTGTRTQWIDNGPPKTEAPPARSQSRLYRVVVTP